MSDYEEFINRSEEDVVLAIFDKLGMAAPGMPPRGTGLSPACDQDRSWADSLRNAG